MRSSAEEQRASPSSDLSVGLWTNKRWGDGFLFVCVVYFCAGLFQGRNKVVQRFLYRFFHHFDTKSAWNSPDHPLPYSFLRSKQQWPGDPLNGRNIEQDHLGGGDIPVDGWPGKGGGEGKVGGGGECEGGGREKREQQIIGRVWGRRKTTESAVHGVCVCVFMGVQWAIRWELICWVDHVAAPTQTRSKAT